MKITQTFAGGAQIETYEDGIWTERKGKLPEYNSFIYKI